MSSVSDIVFAATTLGFTGFHGALGRWLIQGVGALRPERSHPIPDEQLPTVTVLVAARNEARHVPELVAHLLALDYPEDRLQCLVIDDRSTDGTGGLVTAHSGGKIQVVRVDRLPPGMAPKKNALQMGLERSQAEFVLTLDADNRPSPGWVRSMISMMDARTAVVAGLVHHGPCPVGVAPWFHGLWALDVFAHAAVQAGAIGGGLPINANGGNLAFRRRAFDELGGYARHMGIVSGDDDFLIQAAADSGTWNVRCAIDPASQVPTQGPVNFRQAWEQRKRWGSKCIRYDARRVALLSGIFASYLWIVVLLVTAIGFPLNLFWAGLLTSAVFLEAWLLLRAAGKILLHSHLLRWFPLTALVQIPLVIGAVFWGTFGRFQWKDGWTQAKAKVKG